MTENLKTLSDSLQCYRLNVYAAYATVHSPVSSTFLYTLFPMVYGVVQEVQGPGTCCRRMLEYLQGNSRRLGKREC